MKNNLEQWMQEFFLFIQTVKKNNLEGVKAMLHGKGSFQEEDSDVVVGI